MLVQGCIDAAMRKFVWSVSFIATFPPRYLGELLDLFNVTVSPTVIVGMFECPTVTRHCDPVAPSDPGDHPGWIALRPSRSGLLGVRTSEVTSIGTKLRARKEPPWPKKRRPPLGRA